jgi:hypothetical protein
MGASPTQLVYQNIAQPIFQLNQHVATFIAWFEIGHRAKNTQAKRVRAVNS